MGFDQCTGLFVKREVAIKYAQEYSPRHLESLSPAFADFVKFSQPVPISVQFHRVELTLADSLSLCDADDASDNCPHFLFIFETIALPGDRLHSSVDAARRLLPIVR